MKNMLTAKFKLTSVTELGNNEFTFEGIIIDNTGKYFANDVLVNDIIYLNGTATGDGLLRYKISEITSFEGAVIFGKMKWDMEGVLVCPYDGYEGIIGRYIDKTNTSYITGVFTNDCDESVVSSARSYEQYLISNQISDIDSGELLMESIHINKVLQKLNLPLLSDTQLNELSNKNLNYFLIHSNETDGNSIDFSTKPFIAETSTSTPSKNTRDVYANTNYYYDIKCNANTLNYYLYIATNEDTWTVGDEFSANEETLITSDLNYIDSYSNHDLMNNGKLFISSYLEQDDYETILNQFDLNEISPNNYLNLQNLVYIKTNNVNMREILIFSCNKLTCNRNEIIESRTGSSFDFYSKDGMILTWVKHEDTTSATNYSWSSVIELTNDLLLFNLDESSITNVFSTYNILDVNGNIIYPSNLITNLKPNKNNFNEIKKIKLPRGNSSSISNYLGDSGEITINNETNQIYIHDGKKVGGNALNSEDTIVRNDLTKFKNKVGGDLYTLENNLNLQIQDITNKLGQNSFTDNTPLGIKVSTLSNSNFNMCYQRVGTSSTGNSAICIGNNIYIFGGEENKSIRIYDIDKNELKTSASQFTDISNYVGYMGMTACQISDTKICIMGGYFISGSTTQKLTDVFEYDIINDTIVTLDITLPTSYSSGRLASCFVDNNIYLFNHDGTSDKNILKINLIDKTVTDLKLTSMISKKVSDTTTTLYPCLQLIRISKNQLLALYGCAYQIYNIDENLFTKKVEFDNSIDMQGATKMGEHIFLFDKLKMYVLRNDIPVYIRGLSERISSFYINHSIGNKFIRLGGMRSWNSSSLNNSIEIIDLNCDQLTNINIQPVITKNFMLKSGIVKPIGLMCFDEINNRPIWWNGYEWTEVITKKEHDDTINKLIKRIEALENPTS